tara:strand:+ start:74 stop:571 length:498 start_codon:yes stop_codon:yes gene_type:complete
MSNNDYIVVGKILATHGIKGWLSILSYTHPIENIVKYDLYIKNSEQLKSFNISNFKFIKKKLIIKIDSIENINDAESYKNLEIYIKKQSLPETKTNEYYWHDLIGKKVFTTNNNFLGIVDSLFSTDANDILLIKHENNNDTLIPFIKEFIIQVKDKENTILVKLP